MLTRADLEALLRDERDAAPDSDERADLTVSEIAERFGRSAQTVRDWIKTRKLRAYRFNGKEYRVTPAALEEFEEGQRNGRARRTRSGRASDLGAWRREREAG